MKEKKNREAFWAFRSKVLQLHHWNCYESLELKKKKHTPKKKSFRMNPYSPPIRGGHNKSLKLAKEIIVRAKTEERSNMGLPKKRGKWSEKIGFLNPFFTVFLACFSGVYCISPVCECSRVLYTSSFVGWNLSKFARGVFIRVFALPYSTPGFSLSSKLQKKNWLSVSNTLMRLLWICRLQLWGDGE